MSLRSPNAVGPSDLINLPVHSPINPKPSFYLSQYIAATQTRRFRPFCLGSDSSFPTPTHNADLTAPKFDSGGGGGGRDGGDSFSGGGGDGGGDEEDAEGEEFGPLLKFDEVMKECEARGVELPLDMIEAAKTTGLRKVLFLRYLALQGSALLGWSMKYCSMIPDRMLADPSFLFKVGTEIVIDSCCATFAEVQKRGKDFWNEFEFYATDLLVGIVVDIALVGMLAPYARIGKPSISHGLLGQLQQSCAALPSSFFEAERRGSRFSVKQRVASFFYKVLKNIAGFPKRLLKGINLQDASLAKKKMEDLINHEVAVFQACGTAFIEVHPFTSVDGEPFALDMRGELDDAAPFKNLYKMLLNLVSSGYVEGNTASCIGELPEEIQSVLTDILHTSTHINFQTQGLCVSSKNRANPPQYTVNHDKSEKGHPVKVFRVTLDQVFHEIGEIYPLALGDAEALHEATRNETLRHNNAGGLFGYPTPNLEDYTVVYYHETADHRLIRLQCPNIEFPWYVFVLLLSGVAVFDGPTGNVFVA